MNMTWIWAAKSGFGREVLRKAFVRASILDCADNEGYMPNIGCGVAHEEGIGLIIQYPTMAEKRTL